jgi:hypothetical protein
MEYWNARAADAIRQRNQIFHGNDPYVLDVHNLTRKEALEQVKVGVNEWFNMNGASAAPKQPLKIITGSGVHSMKHQPVLLPTILSHLRKEGWRIDYEPGQGGYIFGTSGRKRLMLMLQRFKCRLALCERCQVLETTIIHTLNYLTLTGRGCR